MRWPATEVFSFLLILASLNPIAIAATVAASRPDGITVQGSGTAPQLGFACCDRGIEPMQSLFADPSVIRDLSDLHAEVAVAISDFSQQRAEVVHRLNQSGIPVVAWIMLPKDQGFYLNADNVAEAAARVGAFEEWTAENGLKWAAVGLDIEPNFTELTGLKNRWRLVTTLLSRALNSGRLANARKSYSAIIGQLQSRGYLVQTYQMPYLPAERSVHSTVLDRILGSVDVRADTEYLMLYTSGARPIGAGMIWSNGGNAQAIVIGVTDGDTAPGTGSGPLNWDEFSRDLIVANHFTHQIGVYNLEGCVRQGFLSRLKAMDWRQSVNIPSRSISRAHTVGFTLRTALWIASNGLYFLIAVVLLFLWAVWRRRTAEKKKYP